MLVNMGNCVLLSDLTIFENCGRFAHKTCILAIKIYFTLLCKIFPVSSHYFPEEKF